MKGHGLLHLTEQIGLCYSIASLSSMRPGTLVSASHEQGYLQSVQLLVQSYSLLVLCICVPSKCSLLCLPLLLLIPELPQSCLQGAASTNVLFPHGQGMRQCIAPSILFQTKFLLKRAEIYMMANLLLMQEYRPRCSGHVICQIRDVRCKIAVCSGIMVGSYQLRLPCEYHFSQRLQPVERLLVVFTICSLTHLRQDGVCNDRYP